MGHPAFTLLLHCGYYSSGKRNQKQTTPYKLTRKHIMGCRHTNHLAIHGVLPEEAEQVIGNNPLDVERQIRNGEERILHLGETSAGRVLFVVATFREEMIRVVTSFPANRKARKLYLTLKGPGVEDD
jgi:uncharacterized protein